MMVATAIAIGIAGVGVGGVYAATSASNTSNPMSTLVHAIAQKFNLNESDVQQVFDDQHGQMEAQHTAMFADHLAQAVTEGKLTQAQADLITAKKAELEAKRDSLKDATPTERQAALKDGITSLRQWAKDNNIPLNYLMQMGGMGRGHAFRGMHN